MNHPKRPPGHATLAGVTPGMKFSTTGMYANTYTAYEAPAPAPHVPGHIQVPARTLEGSPVYVIDRPTAPICIIKRAEAS